MILPWLRGILGKDLSPLTWTLVFLNVYIFALTYEPRMDYDKNFFSDSKIFATTANYYYQYTGHKGLVPKAEINIWGSRAYHDPDFFMKADQLQFAGDQIVAKEWKKSLAEFREIYLHRNTQVFGLSSLTADGGSKFGRPLNWITYQFMHAGFVHLLSNMSMFLIFGGALEAMIGSLGLLLVYLVSGIVGGWAFLAFGGGGFAPMIGASGALTGVMAFYTIFEKRKAVPFFFFISPMPGYFGRIWLPTLTIFPLFFVTDIAAYFGTNEEIGAGVAYMAHLGGMVFGTVSALTVLWLVRKFPVLSQWNTAFIGQMKAKPK